MATILVIAPGSRGDIQPFIALGRGLKDAGHTVRIVTHGNYESLLAAHALELWPLEDNIQQIVEGEKMRDVLENGSLLASMSQMSKIMTRTIYRLAERSLQASQGADLIIAGFSGLFVAQAVAEKTHIPFLQAYNVPFTPTSAFPGALLPPFPFPLGATINRLTHNLTQQVIWQTSRPADEAVRKELLGLPPVAFGGPFGSAFFRQAPVLYGFSPAFIQPPADWDTARIHVTGFWNLEPSSDWRPPQALTDFIEAGPAPIYVGFGSMSNRQPGQTADLVLSALQRVDQRAIVFSGWAGLQKENLPDNIFMIDSTPHSWLFPRMSAVVHHGGAGTTAAGLRAGVPAVVVPFHGDQPFWGSRVAAAGVGPTPIPRSRLTASKLADAMQTAINDSAMRQRASQLGAKMQKENGVAAAVKLIEASLRTEWENPLRRSI